MSEWTEIKNESGYKIYLLDTEINQFWISFSDTKYFNWIELNSLEIGTKLMLSQWYLMSYFIAISRWANSRWTMLGAHSAQVSTLQM